MQSTNPKRTVNQAAIRCFDRLISEAEAKTERLRKQKAEYEARHAERVGVPQAGEKQGDSVSAAGKAAAPEAQAGSDFIKPGVKKSFYNTVVAHEGAVITLDNGQRWEVSDHTLLRKTLSMDTVKVVLDRDDDPNSWRLWNAADEEDTTAVEVRPRGQRQKGNK